MRIAAVTVPLICPTTRPDQRLAENREIGTRSESIRADRFAADLGVGHHVGMDDLLGAVRARAMDGERRSDMAAPHPLPEPATDGELAAAESRLGFALPSLVRALYTGVANGGFGPGYGLVGIGGGERGFSSGNRSWWCEDEYLELLGHPSYPWPAGMLPVCDWGCGIYSCLDTTSAGVPVVRVYLDAVEDQPDQALQPEGHDLAGWLRAWTDGTDLWESESLET
jgi:SMI1 / KNR4 family (SUKH-1)